MWLIEGKKGASLQVVFVEVFIFLFLTLGH